MNIGNDQAERRIQKVGASTSRLIVAQVRFPSIEAICYHLCLNAVQSGAQEILVHFDTATDTLCVCDDGKPFAAAVLSELSSICSSPAFNLPSSSSLTLLAAISHLTITQNGARTVLSPPAAPFVSRLSKSVSVSSPFHPLPARHAARRRPTGLITVLHHLSLSWPALTLTLEPGPRVTRGGPLQRVGPHPSAAAAFTSLTGVPHAVSAVTGDGSARLLLGPIPTPARYALVISDGTIDEAMVDTVTATVLAAVQARGLLRNAHLSTAGRSVAFTLITRGPIPIHRVTALTGSCLDQLGHPPTPNPTPSHAVRVSPSLAPALPGFTRGARLTLNSTTGCPTRPTVSDIGGGCGAGEVDLRSLTVIGQFQDTFIVCADHAGLVYIDQHAAAERITLERLTDALRSATPIPVTPSSRLTPLRLTDAQGCSHCGSGIATGPGRATVVLGSMKVDPPWPADDLVTQPDRVAYLAGWGWVVTGGWVTAHPVVLDVKLDRPEYATQTAAGRGVPELIQQIVLSKSCRLSVKAGARLTDADCRALVDDLAGCRSPWYCAHGRPTVVRGHPVTH